MALSNAERQARYRERRHSVPALIEEWAAERRATSRLSAKMLRAYYDPE